MEPPPAAAGAVAAENGPSVPGAPPGSPPNPPPPAQGQPSEASAAELGERKSGAAPAPPAPSGAAAPMDVVADPAKSPTRPKPPAARPSGGETNAGGAGGAAAPPSSGAAQGAGAPPDEAPSAGNAEAKAAAPAPAPAAGAQKAAAPAEPGPKPADPKPKPKEPKESKESKEPKDKPPEPKDNNPPAKDVLDTVRMTVSKQLDQEETAAPAPGGDGPAAAAAAKATGEDAPQNGAEAQGMYPKQRLVQKITEAARQGVLPWEQSFFLIKNMDESPRPERGFDAGMTFLEKPKRERPGNSDSFRAIGGVDAWLDVPPVCPLLRRRVGRIEAPLGQPPSDKALVYVEYTALVPGGKSEDESSGSLFQVIDGAWLGPHGVGLGANELGFFEVHTSAYSASERYRANASVDAYCLGPPAPPAQLGKMMSAHGGFSGGMMGTPRSPRSPGRGMLVEASNNARKYALGHKEQVALIHGVQQYGEDWQSWRKMQVDSRYPFARLTPINLEDAWRALKRADSFEAVRARCLAEVERTNMFGPIDYLQLHAAQVQYHARRVAESRCKAESVEREESRNRAIRGAPMGEPQRELSFTEAMSSCAMCRRPQTDRDPLCGPYRVGDGKGPATDKRQMCHRSCLMWCPQVKIRPNSGQMRHVVGAIKASLRQVCMICGNRGANTRCSMPGCRAALHLACANESPHCALDVDQRTVYCINHARGKPANQLLIQDVVGDEDVIIDPEAVSPGQEMDEPASKEERLQQAMYEVMHNGLSKTVAAKRQSISVKLLTRHIEAQEEQARKQHAVNEDARAPEQPPIPGGVEGVADAPVFRPSEKEFRDPMAYIRSIRPEAEKGGICTIVPPPSWNAILKLKPNLSFNARQQKMYGVPPTGVEPGFPTLGRQFTPDSWREFSRAKSAKLLGEADPRAMKDVLDQDVIGYVTDKVADTEKAFWELIREGERIAQTVASPQSKGKASPKTKKTTPPKQTTPIPNGSHQATSPLPNDKVKEETKGEASAEEKQAAPAVPAQAAQAGPEAASDPNSQADKGPAADQKDSDKKASDEKCSDEKDSDKKDGAMAAETGPASATEASAPPKPADSGAAVAMETDNEGSAAAEGAAAEGAAAEGAAAGPETSPEKAAAAAAAAVTEVFYGTDIPASGMNKTMSDWNLAKFVQLKNNILKFGRQKIPGVTTPMMYFAMIYSQFCWHAEDNDLYSISYLHSGCPKTWYGIPSAGAAKFEEAFRAQAARQMGKHPDLQYLKSIMWPTPEWLVKAGHKVTRAVQEAGQFVITFPRAYHAGFSHGANIGEAVNFATADWLPFGREVMARYRENKLKVSIIHQEQLLLDLAASASSSGTAGEQVLSQTRAELHTMRGDFERMFKESEAEGIKLHPATGDDAQFQDMQGVYCEICNQSCHIAALVHVAPEAEAGATQEADRWACMYHGAELQAKVQRTKKPRCIVWKALEDIDESISLIDGYFQNGGLATAIQPKRCSICTRGGQLVGPYGEESFYVHERCLLFSRFAVADPNGFIDAEDVRKVIREGLQIRCAKCRGFGATVDCCAVVTSKISTAKSLPCRNSYHYECANRDPRVALDHMTYTCHCSAHSRPRPSSELKPLPMPHGEYLDDEELAAGAKAGAKSGRNNPDFEDDDRTNYIAMMSPRLLSQAERSGSMAGLSARRSAFRKPHRLLGEVFAPPRRMLRPRLAPTGKGGAATTKRRREGEAATDAPADAAAAQRSKRLRTADDAAPAALDDSDAVMDEGAGEEDEMLRRASRRAMGLRDKPQKPVPGDGGAQPAGGDEAPEDDDEVGARPSKRLRRKAQGAPKKTVYPGGFEAGSVVWAKVRSLHIISVVHYVVLIGRVMLAVRIFPVLGSFGERAGGQRRH